MSDDEIKAVLDQAHAGYLMDESDSHCAADAIRHLVRAVVSSERGNGGTSSGARWMGRPIAELSREQLILVIERCGREMQELREDRGRWMAAADPVKYLVAGDAA